MCFTGFIENSTNCYPLRYINSMDMGVRGSSVSLVCKTTPDTKHTCDHRAACWIDRTTAGISTNAEPQEESDGDTVWSTDHIRNALKLTCLNFFKTALLQQTELIGTIE